MLPEVEVVAKALYEVEYAWPVWDELPDISGPLGDYEYRYGKEVYYEAAEHAIKAHNTYLHDKADRGLGTLSNMRGHKLLRSWTAYLIGDREDPPSSRDT